ncbi:MAG: sensor histidine kinase [Chloroflexota bacterium]|nr:sensor histidine kinase [Chloroflexota bacterium]
MATTDDIQIVDTEPLPRLWRLSARLPLPADRPVPSAFWLFITVGVLFFLIYPLRELLRTHLSPGRLVVALIGMVIFVSIYLWVMLREPFRLAPLSAAEVRTYVLLLTVIAVDVLFLTLTYSSTWLWFVLYANSAAGMKLPVRVAVITIPGFTLLAVGVTAAARGWSAINPSFSTVSAVSVLMIGVSGMLTTIQQLRAARQEIGRLAAAEAVAEERLRFARDLHDLLGHSLSLIVLKSELAGRLQRVDVERATGEIRDVEGVARTALREVREAVAGYRQPTLAIELPGARIMLAAAGIACDVDDGVSGGQWTVEGREAHPLPTADRRLPPTVDATLAWTVREGVTNIIRHSHARCCTIRVRRAGDTASVEVTDDGVGDTQWATAYHPPLTADSGNGLTGLAERAASHGGSFDAGPCASGGFRLFVSLPSNEQ